MYLIQHSGGHVLFVQTLGEVFAALNDWKFNPGPAVNWTVLVEGFFPLTLLQGISCSHTLGVAIEGDPLAALLRMLDELDPLVRDNGVVRQPWQMLRRQWLALMSVGKLAFGAYPGIAREDLVRQFEHRLPSGTTVRGTLSDCIGAEFLSRYGFGHNGPQYGAVWDTNCRHEVHLMHALAMGRPVPQAVIDEALSVKERFPDLYALEPLLERPYLRGRFGPGLLDSILCFRDCQVQFPITEDNVDAYVRAVALLPADASTVAVDNALYAAGLSMVQLLQPRAVTEHEPAHDDLAAHLARELHANAAGHRLARLDEELSKGQISHRTYDCRKTAAQSDGPASFQPQANRFVRALQQRSIRQLLAVLDTSEDLNQVSKKFAHKHFGLKAMRMRAADRRAAIFRFCGMDARTQQLWEGARDEATAEAIWQQAQAAAQAAAPAEPAMA